jgi:hypothetical protein
VHFRAECFAWSKVTVPGFAGRAMGAAGGAATAFEANARATAAHSAAKVLFT